MDTDFDESLGNINDPNFYNLSTFSLCPSNDIKYENIIMAAHFIEPSLLNNSKYVIN